MLFGKLVRQNDITRGFPYSSKNNSTLVRRDLVSQIIDCSQLNMSNQLDTDRELFYSFWRFLT